jgi:hypothetical protein
MTKYRLATDWYGACDEPWTLEEFLQAMQELNRSEGWAVPNLQESADGSFRVRYYYHNHTLDEVIIDGDPEFDREMWLSRGANWLTVLEPINA